MIDIRLIYDRFTAYPSYLPLITKYPFMCKIWGKGVYLYNKTKNHLKKHL